MILTSLIILIAIAQWNYWNIIGEKTSHEFYDDEFAAAQREHLEKCAALQKQVDDEKKSQSTDGLIVTISDSSGEICKRDVGCLML